MVASPSSPSPTAVVVGVVLAAGRSTRMGRPKALLPLDDETFIERAIRVLLDGGCRSVVAVVGPDAEEAARLAEQSGARVIVNPERDAEQIASIRLGLEQLDDDAAAAAVLPVDHPLVSAGTVAELLREYRRGRASIVRPIYAGAPGHPGIFDRSLFAELSRPDLDQGAHTVVEAHAADRLDVPIRDAAVVADIDTPEDYLRFVEGSC